MTRVSGILRKQPGGRADFCTLPHGSLLVLLWLPEWSR